MTHTSRFEAGAQFRRLVAVDATPASPEPHGDQRGNQSDA
jgi:hypothetical protein